MINDKILSNNKFINKILNAFLKLFSLYRDILYSRNYNHIYKYLSKIKKDTIFLVFRCEKRVLKF